MLKISNLRKQNIHSDKSYKTSFEMLTSFVGWPIHALRETGCWIQQGFRVQQPADVAQQAALLQLPSDQRPGLPEHPVLSLHHH